MTLLDLFPGKWMIYAGICAGAVALGAAGAWTIQGLRLDKVEAEYAGFVASVKAKGEAAKVVAEAQEAQDKLNKQKADDENKRTTDKLRADIKRLRDTRASGSYLPPASPGTTSPNTATIDRAEFERAVGVLDKGVQALVDEGSKAIIDLNTAKIWAAK